MYALGITGCTLVVSVGGRREVYVLGRLLPFLFIYRFCLSKPLQCVGTYHAYHDEAVNVVLCSVPVSNQYST